MKKLIATLLLAAATLGQAATLTTLIGSLQAVNGTTNSGTISLTTAPIQAQSLGVQTGGLASTNALTLYGQVSLDGTNFVTIATYHPTGTNAGSATWSTSFTNLTMYARVQVVSTNAITVGVTLSQ